MIKPEVALTSGEYHAYRSVRALARVFILVGGLLLLYAGSKLIRNPGEPLGPLWDAGVAALLGGLGLWAGFAVLLEHRRSSPVVYVASAIYAIVIPSLTAWFVSVSPVAPGWIVYIGGFGLGFFGPLALIYWLRGYYRSIDKINNWRPAAVAPAFQDPSFRDLEFFTPPSEDLPGEPRFEVPRDDAVEDKQ